MKEITLVTAFFDIGRESFKAIPRSNKQYVNYFKFWARMNNKLIVYTDANTAKDVLTIRREFGLEERTEIVIIDDIYQINPDIYESIKQNSENQYFIDFRKRPKDPSNDPRYDYVTLMKFWFLMDAAKRKYTSEFVAWIDFGFNHGGKVFKVPEDFDFQWEYDFSERIHLFYLNKLDDKPIFEIVRTMDDYLMMGIIMLPIHLCEKLWELSKESMAVLSKVGFVDDDQLIMLISYKSNPELFELHKSSWFLPLKEYGGTHLTVRSPKKIGMLKRMLLKIYFYLIKRIDAIRYAKRTYSNLMKK